MSPARPGTGLRVARWRKGSSSGCARRARPSAASDRIKTDKRDAIRLARLLAAGELVLVTIPSVEREQLRDLVRCREDIRTDLVARPPQNRELPVAPRDLLGGHGEAWTLKHRSG